jgi:group I intron endonuclease
MSDEKFCVYKHIFPNGKIYIGITCQSANRRWRDNGNGYKGQSLMFNAIIRYGWDNVLHEIIFDNISKIEAEQAEIDLIEKYKSNKRKHGYNITKGGEYSSGYKLSEKTKAKMSLSRFGKNNPNYGKKMSDEQKKKLSLAHMGKYSDKARTASKKAAIKRMGEKAYNAKKVLQYDKENNFIKEYGSMADAKKATGISVQQIWCC